MEAVRKADRAIREPVDELQLHPIRGEPPNDDPAALRAKVDSGVGSLGHD